MSTEVTKEIPIKENIAIAAFMGKTVYPIKGTKEFKKWKGEACDYHWFDLKYHEDWNQLMLVGKKIYDWLQEQMKNRPAHTATHGDLLEVDIHCAIKEYDIKKTHKAIYNFITWYNTAKQG